ncbi:hypothetical protein DFH08DRAFT_820730 [Mycena albidolilacea]|uniref:Uncharacterized protein n=1 Tax=Mycena albidolilacea TaxID=1033008 RepID=A0AAD7EF10_9AGAR|nr:hypothetical protein DFH08DRAFT_820730 [Mycena albidolilacea]
MRGLPLDDAPKPRHRFSLFSIILSLSIAGILFLSPHPVSFTRTAAHDLQRLPISCPTQHSTLTPAIPFSLGRKENVYVKRLQGAVQIRMETFDGAVQEGDDPRYNKFYEFETYLLETFPDVFANLKMEPFETHGLLLTWQGSDASLSPYVCRPSDLLGSVLSMSPPVLMTHQDTVPDETVERWTRPPFEGYVDHDGWVWGRGVVDCKNTLSVLSHAHWIPRMLTCYRSIAELSAVSELLKAGFSPRRTVLLAFGFDEEGGAVHSARAIADHLEHKYGTDSIFMILDEGGGVMDDYFGRTWVAPATDSKGIVNVKVSVNVPGGIRVLRASAFLPYFLHPPPHTAIGILSALVAAIEAHPPPVKLSVGNPFAEFAMCLREYDVLSLPTSLPSSRWREWTIDSEFRAALGHERTWDVVARLMAERSPLLLTTQAVDIVRGGVKVDALPKEAHVIVNHRVSVDDSIGGCICSAFHFRMTDWLNTGELYGGFKSDFEQDPPADAERYLRLEIPGGVGGEASPVTPARGGGRVFSRTALHLWPDAIVAPYLTTAGTNTRYFVRLTRARYQFRRMRDSHRWNTRTVNERVHVVHNADADGWSG